MASSQTKIPGGEERESRRREKRTKKTKEENCEERRGKRGVLGARERKRLNPPKIRSKRKKIKRKKIIINRDKF